MVLENMVIFILEILDINKQTYKQNNMKQYNLFILLSCLDNTK